MDARKQEQSQASLKRSRLAVCICDCAGTLPERLDLPAVAASTGELAGVSRVVRCNAFCQPGGPQQLLSAMKDQRISRAVIAACAPAYYQRVLEEALAANKIDPHLVGRVNIREHCAWVHPDKAKATEKASGLISSAVSRLLLCERVDTQRVSLNRRVLVIGAGLAGMQSAISLANNKHMVTLISSASELGGVALGQSVVPQAAEKAAELAKLVKSNRRIKVLTGTELLALTGRFGDFHARLSNGQVDCGAVVVATGQSQSPGSGQLPGLTGILAFDDLAKMLKKNPLANPRRIGLVLDFQRQLDCAITRAALVLGKRAREVYGCEVYLFCSHLRVARLDIEEDYQHARQAGVVVVKSLDQPGITQELAEVKVKGVDEQTGRDFDLTFDLLAVADSPSGGNGQASLNSKLRTGQAVGGLAQRDNAFLLPVDSGRKGIFFAGACRGCVEWTQALDDGLAAAQQAHALLPAAATRVPAKRAEVDPAKCAFCLTCYRSCPHGAIVMDQENRAALVEPIMCQACGVCVAECPARAIELVDYTDAQLAITPAAAGATVVFACENSAVLAADSAGLGRMTYSSNVAIVPVPCAGRVDPVHVLNALKDGAEKVVILGCHDQACKYLHGINRARSRVERLREQLTQLGIDADRVQIGSLMAADAGRFVDLVSGFSEKVQQ